MADFTVQTGRIKSTGLTMTASALKVGFAKYGIENVNSNLSFEIKQKTNIQRNLRTIVNDLNAIQKSISQANSTLQNAARYYENAEKENCSRYNLSKFSIGIANLIPGIIFNHFPPANIHPIVDWFHGHIFPSSWVIGPGGNIHWNHVTNLLFAGGISASGVMTFLKSGASGKAYANWKDGIGAEGEANFTAISGKGSVKGPYGIKADGSFDIGNASAKGKCKASLYDADGKLNPNAEISAEAKVSAAKGAINAKWGKANVGASGEALTAKAEASAKVSASGVSAKAGAEAYLAKGEVHGGFSFLGIKVNASASGGIGGVGASAEFKAGADGKVKIGAGLGFLAGGSGSVEIDFSGFKMPKIEAPSWMKNIKLF